MKTKLLTLALFGLMSLSFIACSEEEIAPVNDVTVEEASADCQCDGGLSEREKPGTGQ
jgi:hypothetical protein